MVIKMNNIIKFNLTELEKLNTPFANYILGRSYDLEENGATQDYKKALQYYMKNFDSYPLSQYSVGMSYLYGLGNELEVNEEKGDMRYGTQRQQNRKKSVGGLRWREPGPQQVHLLCVQGKEGRV